jgi:hypothetical protein
MNFIALLFKIFAKQVTIKTQKPTSLSKIFPFYFIKTLRPKQTEKRKSKEKNQNYCHKIIKQG